MTTTRTNTVTYPVTLSLCSIFKQDVYFLFIAPRRRIPNLGILIGIFRMLGRKEIINKVNSPIR